MNTCRTTKNKKGDFVILAQHLANQNVYFYQTQKKSGVGATAHSDRSSVSSDTCAKRSYVQV